MGAGQLYSDAESLSPLACIESFEYSWLQTIAPSFFSLCTLLGEEFVDMLVSTLHNGLMGDDIIQRGLDEHALVFDEYEHLQLDVFDTKEERWEYGEFLTQAIRPKRQRRIARAINWLITLEGHETPIANEITLFWIETWKQQYHNRQKR
ncbi:MAG: hypothetical protein NVSMB38_40330 [Ktedonobacteraceae bacterium]